MCMCMSLKSKRTTIYFSGCGTEVRFLQYTGDKKGPVEEMPGMEETRRRYSGI